MVVETVRLQIEKHKKELKDQRKDFIQSVTEQESDWVKESRLTYLRKEQIELEKKIFTWSNVVKDCEPWFADVIKDLAESTVKQFTRNKREISSWITPRYNSNWIDDGEIQLAMEEDYSEHIEITRHDHNRDWALCPFHQEKTPSFCINKETKKYHCFGCGEGGSLIDLVRKLYGMEFPEAVKFILKK